MICLPFFCFILLATCSRAHFPLVDNAHGGNIFDTWDTAAEITDITRSSSTSRVALCGHLYLWLTFERPDDFDTLMVGGTVPVVERFKDTRVAVAVFGRGLPGIDATQEEIDVHCNRSPVGRLCKGYNDLPEDLQAAFGQISSSLGASDLGVVAVPGVADQSNCDFGEDPLTLDVTGNLYVESSGGDDIEFAAYYDWGGETHCFFHEEFSGSDSWIVQDKLIELGGEGDHFIVFWSPGDNSLGEPTEPAKFGAVFGDEGQSEDFNGETIIAGECSLPSQDFYEQDCHGYRLPRVVYVIESIASFLFGGIFNFFSNLIGIELGFVFNFLYFPFGGAPCVPSFATSIPNVYTCGDDTPDIACTGLCHNHGFCPAEDSLGAFDISECSSDTDSEGFPQCGETCARRLCGADQANTQYGPVGPACAHICEPGCLIFDVLLFCDEDCDMPIPNSTECYAMYEEDEEDEED